MHKEFDFKLWLSNFWSSPKGVITLWIIFSIFIYMFLYVFAKPDFTEAEYTYNALKEIAYNEAEKRNTDYELTDVLREYEIETVEDGFKYVNLIGKDNVNFKFYLSDDYEIIEVNPSWKVSTATTIVAQILTSLLLGLFGGILINFLLVAFEVFWDKIEKKIKN